MNKLIKERKKLFNDLHIFLDDVVHPEMDYEIYTQLKDTVTKLESYDIPVEPIINKSGKRARCGVCNGAVRMRYNKLNGRKY